MSDNKHGPFKDIEAILVTKITKDIDINSIVIFNITGAFEGKKPPAPKDVRRVDFDFTNIDLLKAGQNEPSPDNGLRLTEAFEQSVERLWNHEIDVLGIHHLPGLTLMSFVDLLPDDGSSLQWEPSDLQLLIDSVKGVYSSSRH